MTNIEIKNLLYVPAFIIGMETQPFIILFFFILADIITGIIKSGRIRGWKSITSNTLSFGLIYKLLILTVPLIIATAGLGIGMDLLFLAKGSLSVFILAEAYSILGNIISIKTGKEEEEFDAISTSISYARKVLKGLIENKKDEA